MSTLLVDVIRFVALGCLLVISYQLLRQAVARHQIWAAAILTLCTAAYLIVDWDPIQHYSIYYLFLIGPFGLPFAFYLFSRSLFDDGFRLSARALLLGAGVVLFQFIFYFLHIGEPITVAPPVLLVLRIVQYAISLLFVTLAIAAAVQNRQDDLIYERFRFRANFILFTALLILITLVTELVFADDQIPAWLELLQKLTIAFLAFYFTTRQLVLKPSFLFEKPASSSPKVAALSPTEKSQLDQLQQQMNEEQAWLIEGLTIRQLAERMDIKEYRLRQLINQHLDFRNFNDYLHSYRIAEACRQLTSPDHQDKAILEIAYAVGYQSLAPFNKAFKQITGKTPTEWRRAH